MYAIQFSFDDRLIDVKLLKFGDSTVVEQFTQEMNAICEQFKQKRIPFDVIIDSSDFLLPKESVDRMGDWIAYLKSCGLRKQILISSTILSVIQARRVSEHLTVVGSRAEAETAHNT